MSDRGYTLLELVFGTVLGGIVAFGAYSFLSASKRFSDRALNNGLVTQELDQILEQVRKDISERIGTAGAIAAAGSTAFPGSSPCSGLVITQQFAPNPPVTTRTVTWNTVCDTSTNSAPLANAPLPDIGVSCPHPYVTRTRTNNPPNTKPLTSYPQSGFAMALCFQEQSDGRAPVTSVAVTGSIIYRATGTTYNVVTKSISISVFGDRSSGIQPLVESYAF